MEKIFKIIEKTLNILFDMFILLGIGIVLVWIFAGITPQKSFSSIAYFFQNVTQTITGQKSEKAPVVTQKQLAPSAKEMKVIVH